MSAAGPMPPSGGSIVDFIGDLFVRRGAACYLGERVTMAEHMLQCARRAESAAANDGIVAAALLHDIGYFADEMAPAEADGGIHARHDEAGAGLLADHFPAVVIDCIRYHVAAKRYLCATDPTYHDRLSRASVSSLTLQGGPMNATEARTFERLPHANSILQIRGWDDEAKIPGCATPPFEYYAPLLQRLVDRGVAGS